MTKVKPKEIRLSPSRVNSINDCTWQYYASYHLRLPRTGNDGSKRGTICHALLECLVNPRHRHYIDKIVKARDVFHDPRIARFLQIYARKEQLPLDQVVVNMAKDGLMTHREEINKMIIVALENDFLGKPGDEIKTEIKHTVEVVNGDKKFNILGIVDKVFIRRNDKGEVIEVEIVDYKTSSKKFEEKDLDSNLQGLCYQFFAKKMFPGLKNIKFKFLFLRFPKNPVQEVPYMNDDAVDGFEYYLTYITKYMSTFSEEHAKKGFAKYNFATKFLCGLYGNKKYMVNKKTKEKKEHNEPQFICSVRDPFDYYAIIDAEGNNVRSAMTEAELKAKPDEKVVKRRYLGCPAWHAQAKNLKRDWGVLS
jgi:ATP-dependent helicase/DNAse subunit B